MGLGIIKENSHVNLIAMDTIKNIPLRTFVLLYKSSPKYVVLASVIALLIGILPSINKQKIAPK